MVGLVILFFYSTSSKAIHTSRTRNPLKKSEEVLDWVVQKMYITKDGEAGQVTISTSRLLLRKAVCGDEVALHEAFKDDEVMRYW